MEESGRWDNEGGKGTNQNRDLVEKGNVFSLGENISFFDEECSFEGTFYVDILVLIYFFRFVDIF